MFMHIIVCCLLLPQTLFFFDRFAMSFVLEGSGMELPVQSGLESLGYELSESSLGNDDLFKDVCQIWNVFRKPADEEGSVLKKFQKDGVFPNTSDYSASLRNHARIGKFQNIISPCCTHEYITIYLVRFIFINLQK